MLIVTKRHGILSCSLDQMHFILNWRSGGRTLCRFRERADHALDPPPPLPQAPSPVSEKCNSLCCALVESKGWAPSFLIDIEMKRYNGKETFNGKVSSDEYFFEGPKIRNITF
jgi:hypothetical protein